MKEYYAIDIVRNIRFIGSDDISLVGIVRCYIMEWCLIFSIEIVIRYISFIYMHKSMNFLTLAAL